jgi:hypothetical protein
MNPDLRTTLGQLAATQAISKESGETFPNVLVQVLSAHGICKRVGLHQQYARGTQQGPRGKPEERVTHPGFDITVE